MKVLISFCNQGLEAYQNNLLIYDFDNGEKRYLFQEPCSFTGLTQDRLYIYAVTQELSPRLVVINKKSLKISSIHTLDNMSDAHSMVVVKNIIYIVSTGTDSVMRYRFNKKSQTIEYIDRFWGIPGSDHKADTHHVNSIFIYDNDTYISAFGPKEKRKRWSTTTNGYLLNITKNKLEVTDIFHPHALSIIDNNLYYCESALSKIKKNRTSIVSIESGYVRGLAVTRNFIIFGTSGGRRRSRSSGHNNEIAEAGRMEPSCKVMLYKKMFFNRWTKKYEVDFFPWHNEIYDVMIVQ